MIAAPPCWLGLDRPQPRSFTWRCAAMEQRITIARPPRSPPAWPTPPISATGCPSCAARRRICRAPGRKATSLPGGALVLGAGRGVARARDGGVDDADPAAAARHRPDRPRHRAGDARGRRPLQCQGGAAEPEVAPRGRGRRRPGPAHGRHPTLRLRPRRPAGSGPLNSESRASRRPAARLRRAGGRRHGRAAREAGEEAGQGVLP